MLELDTDSFTRETFIIRLWRENTPQARWTGQIQHVRSGEKVAIQDLDALAHKLRAMLDAERRLPEQDGHGLK